MYRSDGLSEFDEIYMQFIQQLLAENNYIS
jgi:hypothetical protein